MNCLDAMDLSVKPTSLPIIYPDKKRRTNNIKLIVSIRNNAVSCTIQAIADKQVAV